MRLSRVFWIVLAVACGRTAPGPTPVPASPEPAAPVAVPEPAPRALEFVYRPARLSVRTRATSVTVEPGVVDSQRVESETVLSMVITQSGTTLQLAGVVDSLRVEPSRLPAAGTGFTRLRLPISFSGELAAGRRFVIRVDADSSGGCWSEAHALIDPVTTLLPRLPERVVAGARWSDSSETTSCRAGIPVTAREVRIFVLDSLRADGTAVVSYTARVEARGERLVAPTAARVTYSSRGDLRGQLALDVLRGAVRRDDREGVYRIAVSVDSRVRELQQRLSWRADLTPVP